MQPQNTNYVPEPHHTFRVGDSVVTRTTVERYPHAKVPEGATGVVTVSEPGQISVRLDVHFSGLADWNNELIWSDAQSDLCWIFAELRREIASPILILERAFREAADFEQRISDGAAEIFAERTVQPLYELAREYGWDYEKDETFMRYALKATQREILGFSAERIRAFRLDLPNPVDDEPTPEEQDRDIRKKLRNLFDALAALGLESRYSDNTGGWVPVTEVRLPGDVHNSPAWICFGMESVGVYRGDWDEPSDDEIAGGLYPR